MRNGVHLLPTSSLPAVPNPAFTDIELADAGIQRLHEEMAAEKSPELYLTLALYAALGAGELKAACAHLSDWAQCGILEARCALNLIGDMSS